MCVSLSWLQRPTRPNRVSVIGLAVSDWVITTILKMFIKIQIVLGRLLLNGHIYKIYVRPALCLTDLKMLICFIYLDCRNNFLLGPEYPKQKVKGCLLGVGTRLGLFQKQKKYHKNEANSR